jgi:NADPH2:quinone reductase
MRGETMKAVFITEPGEPDVLQLGEVARPEPGPEELLVRIRASGVNRADVIQRRGSYPAPPGWPEDIPGLEYSGTVEAVGNGCSRFTVGDRVMGIVGGGGYAEYIAVHEGTAVGVPEGMSLEDAGAIPEVFMTAFDALFLQMGLAARETVLIHAVGSGVGTAAVQLARAWGVRTIGTSRTPEKLERASELGLDVGVVAGDADWAAKVLEETDGVGVDVILDLVGGPYVAANLRVLAERGRWIVVGVPGGAKAEIDLRRLMGKRASITGTVLRARPTADKVALAEAFAERVVPLLASGEARAVTDRTFPAVEAAAAHLRMESNLNFGKILLGWG